MEGQLTVEHHQHHAGDGDDGADVDELAQTLAAAGEQLCQNDREDGGQSHDDADIGSVGIGQGGVLQEEVEAAAGDADEDEHQLILPRELHGLGTEYPEGQIGKTHAQGDDLHGGVGGQQLLGQDEAAAPDQYGENGVYMTHKFLCGGHGGSLSLYLSIGRRAAQITIIQGRKEKIQWCGRNGEKIFGKTGKS